MTISAAPRRFRGRLYRHALCALAVLLVSGSASAQLMLYPTRIVFEGNERAAQIELINNAAEAATYRISLVNRRMGETGGLSEIDAPLPDERFAEDLLRYSPRQVTLAPGAGQTVRIMVRKPANLESGEYRSHLLFAQQPEPGGASSIEARGAAGGDGIGVRLTMLLGTSIPVIVRHGSTEASVSLTHLELRQPLGESPVLAFQMERVGTESVYGDLSVRFTPTGGVERVIARSNGVAVYTPNPMRRASIALELGEGRLSDGTLRVTYREQAEAGGDLLAEAYLPIH